MGKPERILSNLPRLYNRNNSLLFTIASAVGGRMQEADSLLSEVMRAHWVDFADLGRDAVRDLRYMAALFDLEPRDDEKNDVEAFRTHLKNYIRTYLQGASTVPGVLRLAASTLSLSLEDEFESPVNGPPYLTEVTRRADDAALMLFGFRDAEAHGMAAQPARVTGTRDLSGGIELGAEATLRLALDNDTVSEFAPAPEGTSDLWGVARTINREIGANIATHDAQRLTLTSLQPFPDAALDLGGGALDALFGIAPTEYTGADERPAQVRGGVDHAPAGGVPLVNLRGARYLRLAVDGGAPFEVDCAAGDSEATAIKLDDLCARINATAGAEIAAHDGHVLILTSPLKGVKSRIELLAAPSNDAREALLGAGVRRIQRGGAAAAARLAGRALLPNEVELPANSALRLVLDGGEPRDVALTDDAETLHLVDIVNRINAAMGASMASHDGRFIMLVSPTTGAASKIEVGRPEGDAFDSAELLLGLRPHSYDGGPPTRAELTGLVTHDDALDLRFQRRLWLAVDGGPMRVIDCAGPMPAATSLQQITDAINDAVGTTVAFHQDGRLMLQSPSEGAASALVIHSPEVRARRHFYTRGRVREDAATILFGFASANARGTLPGPARLLGDVDLSRGADLRVANTLRLQVDDNEPLDINVADADRPLVSLPAGIIDKINAAIAAQLNVEKAFVAWQSDGKLSLTSIVEGKQGRIAIGVSTASDAGQMLLGLPAGAASQGRAAERVTFVGMADLARGLDVTQMHRLRMGVDARPVVDIDLQAAVPPDAPPVLTAGQIAAEINRALAGPFASDDSRRITLTSQLAGAASRIQIELAPDHDATAAVFGLSEARSYQGGNATAAQLEGVIAHEGDLDLRVKRHLSLEIDGKPLTDVDCALLHRGAPQPVTSLAHVVAQINAAAQKALGKDVAGVNEGRLVITSPTPGGDSSVKLDQSSAADARVKLLGGAPALALGEEGDPAIITGAAKPTRPLDLSKRSRVILRVDGGEAREIDCAGEKPERTQPDEPIAAINTAFPDLATQDDQRRLMLTAAQQVELVAQRHFALFEYSPIPARTPEQLVRQNAVWPFTNDSVRDEPFEWQLNSLRGVDRPRLTRRDTQAWVQVDAVIPAGHMLRVTITDDDQPRAWMTATAEGDGRAPMELTDKLTAMPGDRPLAERVAEVLTLPVGLSQWQYNDCYGDRFNQAYFGRRSKQGERLPVVPGRFAGGQVCHSIGVFNVSSFYDEAAGSETVFGSRDVELAPQASVGFANEVHQAGRFELQLPSDLPPQFGGRFNEARYAHGPKVEHLEYPGTIFDLPEDERALDEQIKRRPGMVKAAVTLEANGTTPIYDVPFNDDRALFGGSRVTPAHCYLRQPGVLGVVELIAKEPGEWGNAIVVSAPDADSPGAFDVRLRYTGEDVYENAVPKVQAQVVLARAAGVLGVVTRK
jgi:hypothetical protein